MTDFWGLIPAAGAGRRMNAEYPKQYLEISGRTILEHTICRLLGCKAIRGVLVCIAPDDTHWPEINFEDKRLLPAVPGGATRAHSVSNGLIALAEHAQDDDWVLVHDAARPCLSHAALERLMHIAGEDEIGGLLALPISDTIKRADDGQRVLATEKRRGLWRAQTPQMFRIGKLRTAIESALASGAEITDEASAMELQGYSPLLVTGEPGNIKVTLPEDLSLAEQMLDCIL